MYTRESREACFRKNQRSGWVEWPGRSGWGWPVRFWSGGLNFQFSIVWHGRVNRPECSGYFFSLWPLFGNILSQDFICNLNSSKIFYVLKVFAILSWPLCANRSKTSCIWPHELVYARLCFPDLPLWSWYSGLCKCPLSMLRISETKESSQRKYIQGGELHKLRK